MISPWEHWFSNFGVCQNELWCLFPMQIHKMASWKLSLIEWGMVGILHFKETSQLDLVPTLGRSLGEEKGYPLQDSGLENSIDCIVHGVTKNLA